MKTTCKYFIAVLCSVLFILTSATMTSFAESASFDPQDIGNPIPTPTPTIQQEIDDLIKAYEATLQNELLNGETIEVQDPLDGKTLMLIGESAKKMEALWQEVVNRINELSARPAEERVSAVQLIQSIDGVGDVIYLDRDRSPYDNRAQLERYKTSQFIYLIDIATNQIVEINLVDELNINTNPNFSSGQLERKAREFISLVAENVDLEVLKPAFGDKGGEMFFFRWKDPLTMLDGGMPAFIQVGYSQSGDLVHFINTFPFISNKSELTAVTFNEYYANGGSYWQWLLGSYNIQNNAGYCYIYGWCSPKNFYWQTTCFGCVSAKGRWSPNPNQTVKARAFVPSTHATTLQACYKSFYNGGSLSYSKCINQYIYYDAFVSITDTSLDDIRRIELSNQYDSSSTKEIAWDETWVYTP